MAVHVTVVVDDALAMVKVAEPDDAAWFESPAYEYEAVAVPAAVFDVYVAVGVRLSPPAPVTETVHGVRAEPVYVTLAVQLTVVVDVALVLSNVDEPDEPV